MESCPAVFCVCYAALPEPADVPPGRAGVPENYLVGKLQMVSFCAVYLTLSETVENLIRVNSWNSWPAKNATNSTKTITAIWMPSVRNTNFKNLTAGLLTQT